MSDVPPNPEIEHVQEVADKTQAAQGGVIVSTVHHETAPILKVGEGEAPEGAVYVTAGVPDLKVRVLPGQQIVSPEGHPEPGAYGEGDEFAEQGPTAHMLEARGYVEVVGKAS